MRARHQRIWAYAWCWTCACGTVSSRTWVDEMPAKRAAEKHNRKHDGRKHG